MSLTGPTFSIQPTQPTPTLSTYITVFSVAVGAAGNGVEIAGSASKTVSISRIFFTKPSAQVVLIARKQSTASTGGTSTSPTLVPLNSTNAAATATVKQYTTVPTAGTLVGSVYQRTITTSEDATIQFSTSDQMQNGILNGVAETMALNIDAAATITGFIEWVEYS